MMRIISGKYKGRHIIVPRGIRPTQDKVRKALFDILGDIKGISFLELFAGSGSVGFEAVSQGVSILVLVESNRNCQSAIEDNIRSFKPENCRLCPREAKKAIELFYEDKKRFNIIFMDPPYYRDLAKKTLQILGAYDILAPNGFIIVQHFKKDILPETVGDLSVFKRHTYGDTVLSFYKKIAPCQLSRQPR